MIFSTLKQFRQVLLYKQTWVLDEVLIRLKWYVDIKSFKLNCLNIFAIFPHCLSNLNPYRADWFTSSHLVLSLCRGKKTWPDLVHHHYVALVEIHPSHSQGHSGPCRLSDGLAGRQAGRIDALQCCPIAPHLCFKCILVPRIETGSPFLLSLSFSRPFIR